MLLRIGCRSFLIFVAALACAVSPLRADDTEVRDFSIFIDGKESGTSRMTLVQKDDGTSYVSASLNVKFRQLIAEFTLKIDTQEWWKDGKLIAMQTTAVENNKKTDILVALAEKQLRIRINGKEGMLNPDVWPSSYWKLADARFHNKQIPVVEVDTGKEMMSELKYIGTEKLKVGDFQDCFRFRVTAASGPVDLWFDKYHRLVRQEFTESGHKTIVQLTKITR